MSKKDYVLIAGAVRHKVEGWLANEDGEEQSEYIAIVELAKEMASRLQASNARFDQRRFLEACGINKIYTLRNVVTGEIVKWSINQILEEENRDRSSDFIDYTTEDWRDGLELTDYELVSEA